MGPDDFERAARARIDRYRSDPRPSATSVLSTLFGEIVAPRDVLLPVSSIAAVMADLGVSERLVRTSLSRLVGDGLLTRQPVGRRSYYGVDPQARDSFEAIRHRIFGPSLPAWDGNWTVVVVDHSEGDPDQRARLRDQLRWLGLASISPNVLASPIVEVDEVLRTVSRNADLATTVMRSRILTGAAGTLSPAAVAAKAIPLDSIAAAYQAFVAAHTPLVGAPGPIAPESALAFRLLLVSDYRRLVLADPGLPPDLLPSDWPGFAARRVVAALFWRVAEPSEQRLQLICEVLNGPLPPPEAEFVDRLR